MDKCTTCNLYINFCITFLNTNIISGVDEFECYIGHQGTCLFGFYQVCVSSKDYNIEMLGEMKENQANPKLFILLL